MLQIIRDAESRLFNTVALNDLLQGADPRFCAALREALTHEGFELDDPDLSLQHPRAILDSVRWLETLGLGDSWETFKQALLMASRAGILMNLSARGSAHANLAPAMGAPWLQPESA